MRHEGEAQSASTTPAVMDSVLVFGTLDGFAAAFDRQTGEVRWRGFLAQAEVWGEVEQGAGLALVPQYELWAVDPQDGRIAWHFGGPDGGAAVYGVSTGGDTVFTGSVTGWASAVDARNGQAFWSVDLGEAPFEPAVTSDLVIYGTRGFLGVGRQGPLGAGHLIALRRSDGAEVVVGSYVYIIEGPVTIADRDGQVTWEYGGLDCLGRGQSFFAGQVAEDGTIYTLGVERLTGRDGTYVFAIRPPVTGITSRALQLKRRTLSGGRVERR